MYPMASKEDTFRFSVAWAIVTFVRRAGINFGQPFTGSSTAAMYAIHCDAARWRCASVSNVPNTYDHFQLCHHYIINIHVYHIMSSLYLYKLQSYHVFYVLSDIGIKA